jgi:hypothetical protein
METKMARLILRILVLVTLSISVMAAIEAPAIAGSPSGFGHPGGNPWHWHP